MGSAEWRERKADSIRNEDAHPLVLILLVCRNRLGKGCGERHEASLVDRRQTSFGDRFEKRPKNFGRYILLAVLQVRYYNLILAVVGYDDLELCTLIRLIVNIVS
jgi:hypothetical protein